MSQEQINITDMQCWIYRMAQKKWKLPSAECTRLFQQFHLFEFISECYDILHLSSYACALEDVEEILRANGVTV